MTIIKPENFDVRHYARALAKKLIRIFVAEQMVPFGHRLEFAEQPVSFREFIASKNHMGSTTPPLSERQLMLADFMLGETPDDCFENKNHLAVLVLGKGSGKGMLCALFLMYICYLLMCMKSPHEYLNHAAADWIDCINVSPSGDNSDDVFFEKVKQRVLRWPWLSSKYSIKNSGAYISTVKADDAADGGTVTITRDGIIFPKLVRLLSCNSANESAEGKNTLVFTIDEACLAAQQLIRLADGTRKQIGEIVNKRLPVLVMSLNRATGKLEPKRVTNWFRHEQPEDGLITVRLSGKTGSTCITGTLNHWIHTPVGKRQLGLLKTGDPVMSAYGITYVRSVERLSDKAGYVYDIEVEDNHNYFASDVLVSNSAMKADPKSKSNIGNAYTIFNRVLMKSAKTRFARFYKGFVISFPRSENDFTMELYKENLGNLHVYTDKAATWEVLPASKFSGETFEFEGKQIPIEFKDDFEKDPTEAKMTLMADPPAVEGGTFIEYPDRIRLAMESRPPIIDTEEYISPQNKICRRITRFDDQRATQGLYLFVDLGEKKDKAVVAGYHPVFVNDKVTIVQDFIAVWRPDKSSKRTVSFVNVGDFIRELNNRYTVEGVWFDQWQSVEARERLNDAGIPASEYFLQERDYDAFKELLYARRVNLLDNEELFNEVRSLIKKGQRVDHTSSSEKDITDTVVGACRILNQLNQAAGEENYFGDVETIQDNMNSDPWR